MRAEEKQIDGPELARQEELEQAREKKDEEELPHALAEQQRDLVRTERGTLLSAMQAILAREHMVVDMLHLPQHELRALEALKEAVDGRDAKLHKFVLASDRRDLLEQALAVLQPNLAVDDRAYRSLVANVGELRRQLGGLEDAQDELLVDGSQRDVVQAKPPDAPPPETTEVDPDAPKPASTLDGPEITPEPKPPTSLGDPGEIAAAAAARQPPPPARTPPARKPPAKKPWWKRPFG